MKKEWRGKLTTRETEPTHWYECLVWKKMKNCGASLNNEWGLQRILKLRWCLSAYDRIHLCSFTDEEHKKIRRFAKEEMMLND